MDFRSVMNSFNPAVAFVYFMLGIIYSMILNAPMFLSISVLFSSSIYFLYKGSQGIGAYISILVLDLFVIFLGPFFNTMGTDVLFVYLSGRTYTIQALQYSLSIACVLTTMMLWFSILSDCIDDSKTLYLFHGRAKSFTMLLIMTRRMVDVFRNRLADVMRYRSFEVADIPYSKIAKIRYSFDNIASTLSWSLERGIITSESMICRGYDLKCRSTYSIYSMGATDRISLCWSIVLGVSLGALTMSGKLFFDYFQPSAIDQVAPIQSIAIILYILLLIYPIIVYCLRGLRWKFSK